jgi:Ca-activated chloride channel homolog
MNFDFPDPATLHWLRPHWLWALLALPLLAAWWRTRNRQHGAWREAVDPHLLPHLLQDATGMRAHGALWCGLLGGALAICALAGPSWQRIEQPLWQNRAPLVIALDLSTATLANDLPPSRLLQARAKLATLLRTRRGGQVGLVAFAGDAFTVAPLTEDAGNVALFLDALEPDVMPVDGSDAGRAIAHSERLLRQAGFDRGDILLLTDHADRSARDAAAMAYRDGYRVSVLGMGTPAGAAYRDADGRIARASLDADSLQALASSGGGRYAEWGAGDLVRLDVLDPRHAAATATHGEKTLLWRDQGYWLLPPLLLLAVFAFRRGGALAVLLVCVLLPVAPAQAATRDWWLRPDQQAHARMEQGVEAFRKDDFATAGQQWSGLPGADAAYNRGNALARQGEYDAAIAAYDRALQLQPGMADAIANRKAVEAAKKRRPPPGARDNRQDQPQSGKQERQQQGSPQRQQGQPRQQGGAPPEDQGTSPRDARSQPHASPPQQSAPRQAGQSQSSSPSQRPDAPADAKAQRAADAAQRQRMQEALQKARPQPGSAEPAPSQRAETIAERERRLANEAWLRRVPDDPGGLLRAKFQLEYERRQHGGQ